MTICVFENHFPSGLPWHDSAPVRIYADRPYPYWGERPKDHPIPIVSTWWNGSETHPVDLPPGRYWAVHIYFPPTNRPLRDEIEFVIENQTMRIPIGIHSRYITTNIIGPGKSKPACPISIYCCEEIIPVKYPNYDNDSIFLNINKIDCCDIIRQRYQSSVQPRSGEEPSNAVVSLAFCVGEITLSCVQLEDHSEFTRYWKPRTFILDPDQGAVIKILGWDYLGKYTDGIPVPGSAYPGPHGMEIYKIKLDK